MEIFKPVFNNQRGGVAVIVAITLGVLLSFLALAIDVGYMFTTKNELQNAADSAALAAAGKLANLYSLAPDPTTYNFQANRNQIVTAAQAVVGSGKNKAGGIDISISDADIFINNIGDYNDGDTEFEDNDYTQPTAVRVIARRDAQLNTPIATFFANIFGVDTISVHADATAAMSGVDKIDEGDLPIPIGISKKKFDDFYDIDYCEYCDEYFYFYPSEDVSACAGWHVYNSELPLNDDEDDPEENVLDGLLNGTFNSPEVNLTGDQNFYFLDESEIDDDAFVDLKAIFDMYKGRNDPEQGDFDKDPDTWTTSVVVYDSDNCHNPDGEKQIIGFTTITVYEICTAEATGTYCSGVNAIVAKVVCGYTKTIRGTGRYTYGYRGGIVGLWE